MPSLGPDGYGNDTDCAPRLRSFEHLMGNGELPLFQSSAGINYTTETDQATGDMIIRGYQDVYAILEANHEAYNTNDGYNKERDMVRLASIPLALRNKIMIDEGWDPYRPDLYPERHRRLLNDIDYRRLRTAKGRV
jgi:hypothetical protein